MEARLHKKIQKRGPKKMFNETMLVKNRKPRLHMQKLSKNKRLYWKVNAYKITRTKSKTTQSKETN